METNYDVVKRLLNGDPEPQAAVYTQADMDATQAILDIKREQLDALNRRVGYVEEYIKDIFNSDGSISTEVTEIARMLDIELTRQIEGTVTVELSYSMVLPLGTDVDDLEFSVHLNCDTYEAEDFEWNEDMIDHTGEEV